MKIKTKINEAIKYHSLTNLLFRNLEKCEKTMTIYYNTLCTHNESFSTSIECALCSIYIVVYYNRFLVGMNSDGMKTKMNPCFELK